VCRFVVEASETSILVKPMNGINAPQRPDCVAGVRGLELRNVLANYLPEKSHRFAGIQPKFWLRRPFAFELRRRGYAARARRHHPAASLIPPTLLARADEVIE
jgi:hypothetical protein